MPSRLVAVLVALFLMNCGGGGEVSPETEIVPPPRGDRADGAEAPAATDGASTTTTTPASAPAAVPRTFADPLPASGPGVWTWHDETQFGGVPQCMDGSKTGLGINRSPTGSKKVLVFMMGGGACFDGQTCAIADIALSAQHANAEDFAEWSTTVGKAALMNRTRAENPFRDWNYVYVPYCSGDVFSGASAAGFHGRPQIGFRNVEAYLPRLQSTFRDADQLVLGGMSAGGYGAAYNFVNVQKTFDWVDITMIDDSGPPFGSSTTPPCLQQKWKETWSMDKTSPVEGPFPLGFDAGGRAGAGLLGLVKDVVAKHPKNRFAFLSHDGDLVMRYFHGIGHSLTCSAPNLMGPNAFAAGLREIRTIDRPNFSTFYSAGTSHQFFDKDEKMYDATSDDGVSLASWLTKLVTTGDQPPRVPATF